MAAPTFRIKFIDGTEEEFKLLPKAQLAYEAETKSSLRDDIQSLTELYRLTWYAAGKPDKSLTQWIEKVEEIVTDDEDGDEGPDPTTPAA